MSGDLQTMDTADLVRLIVRRTARVEVVSDEDTFEALAITSWVRAELRHALELRFHIDLNPDDFDCARTVGDVVEIVTKTIERRTP